MRTLATLMASMILVTTALFTHALVAADEPDRPAVSQIAAR